MFTVLWEISSCRPPFKDQYNQFGLVNQILRGLRETPIPNTSENYKRIYTGKYDLKLGCVPRKKKTKNETLETFL